jgi:Putative transposase
MYQPVISSLQCRSCPRSFLRWHFKTRGWFTASCSVLSPKRCSPSPRIRAGSEHTSAFYPCSIPGIRRLHLPHLHCLIPAGGLSLDRSGWIRCRKRFFLPVKVLGSLFRGSSSPFSMRPIEKSNCTCLVRWPVYKIPPSSVASYSDCADCTGSSTPSPHSVAQNMSSIPRSLYPSRRHFQCALIGDARGRSDFPLEGVGRRQSAEADDTG